MTSPQKLRAEYTARINRVMDHIEQHIDEPLSLERLSRIAGFSSFHFHRIFRSMVGETLSQFVQRMRVERAASQLLRYPEQPITEIALACGFSGSAAFARVFKDSFGTTASDWRAGAHAWHQKKTIAELKKKLDNPGSQFGILTTGIDEATRLPRWTIRVGHKPPAEVRIEEIPDLPIAYVRHIGPYQGMVEVFEALFSKLIKWATPRGLLQDTKAQILAVYHDNPSITDDDKLRTDACITVPEGTEVSGDVSYTIIAGGRCAVARFTLADDEYPLAWSAVMCGWLPESGFQPDDRLFYERYPNDCHQEPGAETVVDIVVPVRPL
jgi:AraC family transcriptional regulator